MSDTTFANFITLGAYKHHTRTVECMGIESMRIVDFLRVDVKHWRDASKPVNHYGSHYFQLDVLRLYVEVEGYVERLVPVV
jgi:hypothetical protein